MRRRIRLFAVFAAGCMAAAPISAFAESGKTVKLGDIVQISMADLGVNSGYRSLTEVLKEYEEDRESISSGSTEIETNADKILENIVPNLPSDDDFINGSGNGTITIPNKTLTYEEFMELIGKHNQDAKEEYEKAREEAKDNAYKGNKEDAEAIKDAVEKAQNGIDPVTGKPFQDGITPGFYDDFKNISSDAWNWLNNPSMGFPQGDSLDSYYFNDFEDYKTKICLEEGKYSLIQRERLDESEYINDELVYEKDKNDYRDIQYRCASCGKLYGFTQMCSCKKFLDGNVHAYYEEKKGYFDSNGFGSFNDKGEASNNYWMLKGEIVCGNCQKRLTLESLDHKSGLDSKFYFGSNGTWKCHSCQEKYGYDDLNHNGTTADDHNDWSTFNPYFDDFIIPSRPIEQNPNDLTHEGLLEDYISSLPKEKQQEARERLERYYDSISGGDNGGSVNNSELLDSLKEFYKKYAESLSKTSSGQKISKDKDPSKMEQWTEEDYKNYKDAVDEMYQNGVPDEDYWDGEKIKDTSDFADNVNKVFSEWPADRSKWTQEQIHIYEEFREKYGHSETLDEMVDLDIFDKNKEPEDVIKGIESYIAGFTSINDSVTVHTTVEMISNDQKTVSKDYKVKGEMKIYVYDASGKKVTELYALDDLTPVYWNTLNPGKLGKYTVKRSIALYDMKWDIVTANYHMKSEATLPNGKTILLAEKEVTRIKEDKSGLKDYNQTTHYANDMYVNVVQGELTINMNDFYDTERIS